MAEEAAAQLAVEEQQEEEAAVVVEDDDEAAAGGQKKREREASAEDGSEPDAKRLNANGEEEDDPPAADPNDDDDPPAAGAAADDDDPPAAGAADDDDPPAAADGSDDPPPAASGNPGPDGDPGGDDDREFTRYPDGAVSEVMHISKTMVGKLIGKGGATIMGLQSSTGCSIQVDQVTAARGGEFRRVTLKGTPAAVEAAKEAVAAALAAEAPPAAAVAGAGEATAEVWCPPTVVGRIIGRAGETIKLLQAASGAYILVNQNFPEGADRQITASGNADAVERATNMLKELIASDQSSVQGVIQKYGLGRTIKMQCPRSAVGRIIGRGGETVKMLQRKYNASVQIEQGSDPMDVTIIASPSEAEACQAEIFAIISHPEGAGPYGGGGPRGGGGGGGYGMGGGGGYGMGPRPGMHMGMMPYGYGMGMPMGMGMGMGYGMQPYGAYGAAPYAGGYGGGYGGYDASAYGGAAAAGGGGAAPGGGAAGAAGSSVWQAIPDDQGRTYYYNTQTGLSQWEKPAEMP
ncbi:hypothetical protein Rsub_12069 [Raphidocelis subcapitata]|uniref:WW domain-containing protein n=1 Tax=Raphidocelis subcapitata TaxID=307507 RepID=A0A2V0PQV1_9CHLO|nr:hypothetical protein Rsub_12069 [Raphidocelis subcapitata]|eukprot:GBF99605.1 hypothetical protein Rsub_12069 [Raphidocelis subcapitata]